MKIAVVGIGYVGLSISILLSQQQEVVALDINKKKIDQLNNKISPIQDDDAQYYLKNEKLNLRATLDEKVAFDGAEYIIISTPTDYNPEKNYFDTSSVESTIKKIVKYNSNTNIIIKSTIPVGYVDFIKKKFGIDNVIFSPEFLREGKALLDNLYPSRIVIGEKSDQAIKFAELLVKGSKKNDVPVLYTDSREAEAIKLFANTYLAMRVSFFNELDSFSEIRGLDAKQIIDGIGLDSRIGDYYNNPSFGYGGYCLPKDTKQLLANFDDVPQNMMTAVVNANDTRKKHIATMILKSEPSIVGIYRLTMKADSDNFRYSAIQDIIDILKKEETDIIIYEPELQEETFNDLKVVKDINVFKKYSDIIVANRLSDELSDVIPKVYSRDIYIEN